MPHTPPDPSAEKLLQLAVAALLNRQPFLVVRGGTLDLVQIRRILFHKEYTAFRESLPNPPAWGAEEVKQIGDAICELVACHRGFLCDPEVSRWIERFSEDHFSFTGLQREERPGKEPGTRLLSAWEESGRWLRRGKDLTEADRASFDQWQRNITRFFLELAKVLSGYLGGDERKEKNRQRAMIFAAGRLRGWGDGQIERALSKWDKSVNEPKAMQTWKQANRQLIEGFSLLMKDNPLLRHARSEGPETPEQDASDELFEDEFPDTESP